ncbi:Ribonuclease P protein subunit p25-like protein [Camellia lanceoleosa]|nr:Ribonuclease P protein subunit p25-like protein [Camellia lanceoleosa]
MLSQTPTPRKAPPAVDLASRTRGMQGCHTERQWGLEHRSPLKQPRRAMFPSFSVESITLEKGSNEIALKAMGRAINKTVMIAELIERRIAGLHQNTSIGSMDITDTWEPLEEGLLLLETTCHVSVITITLSKKELDTSSAGYQTPIPVNQGKPWNEYDYGEGSPNMRGRGHGGRGRGRGRVVEYNGDGGWDGGRGYGGRGRVRGRGCGFRGRGRGYGGGDMQQDLGGYNDYGGSGAPFAQGRRGRGRGHGCSWGCGRGRGGGQDFRSDGPVQAAA